MEPKTKGIVSLIVFSFVFLTQIVSIFLDYYGQQFMGYFGLVLITILILSLFLSVYYLSFVFSEKRKGIALFLSLILFLHTILYVIFGNMTEFVIEIGVIILLAIVSTLLAHFYLQLEKVKYSFIWLIPAAIIWILFDFFQVHDFQRHAFNVRNVMKAIDHGILTFIMIILPIILIMLLAVNIYLNKRQREESRKKKILLICAPVILLIAFLLIVSVSFLDSMQTEQRAIEICNNWCENEHENEYYSKNLGDYYFCADPIQIGLFKRGTCQELSEKYPEFPKCPQKNC